MRAELLSALLALGVFGIDLLVPSGTAIGALYAGVIVVALWSKRPGLPWIAAGLCTAFEAIAFLLADRDDASWGSLLNLLLNTLAIWSIAAVAGLRQRAEQRANDQAEKLRLAVDGALLGVFDWHLATGAFKGNARLSELLGMGSQPLDRPIEDFFEHIHPEDRSLISGWFTRILETGVAADSEYRFLLPGGGVRWLSSHCRAYFDREGRVERICGALHDVTPRRLADEAHREIERRLRLALAAADLGVFDWDLGSDSLRVDERFAQIYELETTALEGPVAALAESIHPEDRKALTQLLHAVREGDEPGRCEYRILRPGGGVRWVAINTRAYPGPDGRTERIVGVIQDITDRKELEVAGQRVVEGERRARRLAEESRAAAEAANHTKDEFLAVVSHELRAPLSPILGWTELLRDEDLDEDTAREALDTIERNTRSLSRLVSDLLDVSRILAGKLPITARPTTLEDSVADAIDSLAEAAVHKGVRLQVRSEADRRLVSGDPERLRQIAWNLISNAIKFTPANGTIQVSIVDVGGWVELRVSDNGKGIEPEMVPHIFERFWQEDGSLTRASGGLGLGLSIVKHLVERHRGTILVESAGPGTGATFTVRLPALKGRRKRGSAPAARVPSPNERTNLAGLRVLAVDDDAATAAATSAVLNHHGADVRTASSAAEALSLVELWRPDVLVSDLAMPGTDGFALVSELRRREHDSDRRTPAIALSALARAEDRERALAAGFDGYIAKPVDGETLANEIAHAAPRSATGSWGAPETAGSSPG